MQTRLGRAKNNIPNPNEYPSPAKDLLQIALEECSKFDFTLEAIEAPWHADAAYSHLIASPISENMTFDQPFSLSLITRQNHPVREIAEREELVARIVRSYRKTERRLRGEDTITRVLMNQPIYGIELRYNPDDELARQVVRRWMDLPPLLKGIGRGTVVKEYSDDYAARAKVLYFPLNGFRPREIPRDSRSRKRCAYRQWEGG
ncbi:hypothetical protein HYU13_02455 [Candidatus Woesearchaeota archaeon]|nr:hypothetical protein [Candidatus Woesearchaeota archaeon]